MAKTALVYGAGGFIGSHMVTFLKSQGYWVRGVDLKRPEFSATTADDFWVRDLRETRVVHESLKWPGVKADGPHRDFNLMFDENSFDEIYQFAADMGGAGYIFTKEHDAGIMHNSAMINLNLLESIRERNERKKHNQTRVFYSSSACMYPSYNQEDPENPLCSEDSAYPAEPDSEYGWEKLFSERLYLAFERNHGIPVRIARYHNIFGPEGTYDGGKEKAPAALCRKIAMVGPQGTIEVWGDGHQTRSFLYIDECIEGTWRLMHSDFSGPVNIGSEEMVSINELWLHISRIAGKTFDVKYNLDAPQGVRGRNSDNALIQEKLGWAPSQSLYAGLEKTYAWIHAQVQANANTQG